MKNRFLIPILVLAAQAAGGTTFNLPKDAPLFSIETPDKWLTEAKGDVIISRPSKESKVVISIFPVSGAKSLEDALSIAAKQVSEGYRDFALGKSSEEKEGGMNFIGAEAKAKKDGAEIRIFLMAFSPDGQRYFAVIRAFDLASGETYGNEIDRVMDSIKSFKEEERKAREKHDKATSTVPFPKDKPAFTIDVPNGFAVDATADRLIIKTRKERKSLFHLAAIPSSDGVTDEASAKAWLPKRAQAVLKTLGSGDATDFSEVEDHLPDLAGHKAFEIRYKGGDPGELRMWVFTPDGKQYFYAWFQEKTEDSKEGFQDAEADINPFWRRELLTSIKTTK